MIKSGGIFPFLAEILALIAAAAPAVTKAAALGEVGTVAGMALRKATGKGYEKGGNISMLPALMTSASAIPSLRNISGLNPAIMEIIPNILGMITKKPTGQGYRKNKGRDL